MRECFEVAARVVLLLRLNFLATSSRSRFMRTYAPDIYVPPQRPSFNGRGTDSQEYAWLVWGLPVSRRRNTGIVRVLADTDKKTRLTTSPGLYTAHGYIRPDGVASSRSTTWDFCFTIVAAPKRVSTSSWRRT